MEFLELAKKRYSCRSLSDRPVPQELLDRIIEAGLAAPTAVNKQPIHIWLLASDAAKEAVHAVTHCTFGAEVFLLVGCRPEEAWVRSYDGKNFAEVDGAIAATHMMLEIEALGLATTWVGHFDAPKLKAIYPELADETLIAIFPVGYAADDAAPSERHGQRKTPCEAVTVL